MRYRFTFQNAILGTLVLPVNPQGWEEMSILCKRSPKYHGIIFEETVSLQFLCGSGLEYLEQARDSGIDTEVILLIESECYVGEGYSEEYTGKVQLKTLSTLNGRASVDIVENTIVDTVLNRMDTAIDLGKLETLDGTTLTPLTYGPYTLNLHSKAIIFKSIFKSEIALTDDYVTLLAFWTSGILTLPFYYPLINNELDFAIAADSLIPTGNAADNQGPITPDNPFSQFTATADGIYTIKYKLKGTVTDSFDPIETRTCTMSIEYRVGVSRTNIQVCSPGGVAGAITYAIDCEGEFNVNIFNGDTISFYIYIESYSASDPGGALALTVDLTSEGFISFEKLGTTASTTCNAYGFFETGSILANAITDQTDGFRSTLYGRKNSEPYSYSSNGCASFRAIAGGSAIRNFPITERPTRVTMNDFFDTCNAIDNIGMGIEDGKVVFEKKSYFYSDTRILQLSNVPNIKKSVAPEYYYNKVNIGYNKWQIEQLNGLDEVNSKRQYDLGLKSIDNPLDLISPMIGGAYPLETARRKQYFDTFTEDTDTDNDNFIICLNKSVDASGVPNNLTTAEKDENFTEVNNTLDPSTTYNLDISPGRNFLRHSPVLNVGLLSYPGRNVKFTSGEGNFKMSSKTDASACPGRWNNELFGEGDNVQWDDANNTDNNPLWIPIIATFIFPLSASEFKLIKADPYGYIEVSERSTVYGKWYILEAKRKLVGGKTEFKLLKKWQ